MHTHTHTQSAAHTRKLFHCVSVGDGRIDRDIFAYEKPAEDSSVWEAKKDACSQGHTRMRVESHLAHKRERPLNLKVGEGRRHV